MSLVRAEASDTTAQVIVAISSYGEYSFLACVFSMVYCIKLNEANLSVFRK